MLAEGYTRKSRALGDPDDPGLLATHVDLIHRMAKEDGVELPAEAIYTEVGSGETISERPTFLARLLYWESLPRDTGGVLYVPELARLSRGRMSERGRIFDALERAGIRIRTPRRTWNLSQPDEEMYYGMETSMDRAEVMRYKQRRADAWEKMLRDGKSRTGRKVFGYRHNYATKLPEADPETFDVLCRLLEDAFHLSTRELAHKYVLPRWIVVTAITSPIVCGYPAQTDVPHNGSKSWKRKRHVRLPLEQWRWPEKAGNYPAAISRERFIALQCALHARRKGESRAHTDAGWCRDVLRFEGQPEGARVRLGHGHATSIPTYEVPTARPPSLYIHRDAVHQAARTAIAACWADPGRIVAVIEQQQDRFYRANDLPREHRLRQVEARLAVVRREYKQYVAEEVLAGGERRRVLSELVAEREAEIAGLLAQINDLRDQPEIDHGLAALVKSVLPKITNGFEVLWEEATDVDRRVIVRGTLSEILVRVTPGATNRKFRREIVAITPHPWFRSAVPAPERDS